MLEFYRIDMAPPYQILDWYGGRPTCHTASSATAHISVRHDIVAGQVF